MFLKPELTVGEPVVVVNFGSVSGSVKRSTIEKVLKRDVVLADGQRFNRATCQRQSGTWGSAYYLVSPDEPRVAELLAEIREREQRVRAIAVMDEFRRQAGRSKDPRPVIRALAELLPESERAAVLAALPSEEKS